WGVAVLEEHGATGQPVHCTGLLAAEAFLKFSLPANVILNEVKTARFFSPSNQTVVYSTPKVEAVVIDRNLFDQSLTIRAEDAGAQVLRGRRVTTIEVGDHRVRLR